MSKSKLLDTFFTKKFVGLELLQNPHKSKKKSVVFQSIPVSNDTYTSTTELETFRNVVQIKLNSFQLPLRPFERTDPIMVLLEATYYQYFGQQHYPNGFTNIKSGMVNGNDSPTDTTTSSDSPTDTTTGNDSPTDTNTSNDSPTDTTTSNDSPTDNG
jgi:hypothetical protein